jgi:hypothetical protein
MLKLVEDMGTSTPRAYEYGSVKYVCLKKKIVKRV